MAAEASYELHIDLDGTRTFDGENEDLSAYWRSMNWQLGVHKLDEKVARDSTLTITLDNRDGRFSPQGLDALPGFAPGALIRLRSVFGGETRQHFIGWVEPGGIQPAPGRSQIKSSDSATNPSVTENAGFMR